MGIAGIQGSAAVLLLVTVCCLVDCTLITPIGQEVEFPKKGIAFSFKHEITVFGEKLPASTKSYANRLSARITLGDDTHDPDFYPENRRLFSMLQPSELYNERYIDGVLFHQELQGETEQFALIRDIVRANFWNTVQFNPIGGYLFTWPDQRLTSTPEQSNELQAALVYDESSTYVLYNYNKMELNTTVRRVMAGFSRKGTFDSAYLPFTGDKSGKLPKVSGVSNRTLGLYIYRVDTWPPRRGGCLTEDPQAKEDRVLFTTITQDSVLGGGLALVSGRCPDPGVSGTCYVTMGGNQLGESPAVSNCTDCRGVFLACPVPPSFREGRATLSLKISTNENVYSADFTFVSPDESEGIRLNGGYANWMQLSGSDLKISFDPKPLRGSLTLRIVGYSESGLSEIGGNSNPTKVLHSGPASNAGSMELNSLSCPSGLAECETHHTGFLEIVDSSNPPVSIRSRVIPLGWFVHKYYTDKQKQDWYRDKCKSMPNEDPRILEQLSKLTCPSTLTQARADSSRYLQLNYCPELPDGCSSATPKQQCFVSRPETNVDIQGAPAAVCCYTDPSGNMLYQESLSSNGPVTQHGSRSVRSHPDGLPQSSKTLPGQVSIMSHWYWDTLRFLYCCRWSSTGDCPYYFMHQRPTPKTSGYVAGRGSASVGDPHVSSFSGRQFLFNGYGEYWLLRSDNFQLQGRYLKLPDVNNATFLVAVAVRVGAQTPTFEASVLPAGSSPRFRVQRRSWGSETPTNIQLSVKDAYIEGGVTVRLYSDSNLVIQLASNSQSIGVDLYAADGFEFMNAFVSVSDEMKGKTQGLIGRWTDDPEAEFVDITGNTTKFVEDQREFDAKFCSKNLIASFSDSLFNYDDTRANGFYKIDKERQIFAPSAVFSTNETHAVENATCLSDQNCLFDIRVTKKPALAKITATQGATFLKMQASLNSSDSYCDLPNVRGIQITADTVLRVSTTLTLVCVAPLSQSRADASITCTRQGDGKLAWVPSPSETGFECRLDSAPLVPASQANVGLIVGITVPLAVIIIVAVIVTIVVLRRGSNSSGANNSGRPGKGPPQGQGSQATIVSAGSESHGGYDNHGQGNRRLTPRPAAGNVGSGGDVTGPGWTGAGPAGPSSAPPSQGPVDSKADPTQSQQTEQMEPLEPVEYNPNEYATTEKPQISKSEIV